MEKETLNKDILEISNYWDEYNKSQTRLHEQFKKLNESYSLSDKNYKIDSVRVPYSELDVVDPKGKVIYGKIKIISKSNTNESFEDEADFEYKKGKLNVLYESFDYKEDDKKLIEEITLDQIKHSYKARYIDDIFNY